MEHWTLNESIAVMAGRLEKELAGCHPSMMLFGSVVLDDFQLGWSDVDFLLLTEEKPDETLARELVFLRQRLTDEYNGNPYFRLFEGAILTKDGFFANQKETVVYWGTSGQRLTQSHLLDPFARMELIENGRLLFGADYRALIGYPTREEVVLAIKNHYHIIRQYGRANAGWMLDTARCLYTLRTGAVIGKTKAGEWALRQGLCPDEQAMEKTLEIRRNPRELLKCEQTRAWLNTLEPAIQRFADILEAALGEQEGL